MSVEENKALVRRFIAEVVSKGDFALADELLAPEYVLHFTRVPEPLNRDSFKGFLGAFRTAFPDMQESVDDLAAEDDKVAVRGTTRGTHKREFHGIAPTGRPVEVPWASFFRIAGSRIVEDRGNFDNLGLMEQLGVIPTRGWMPA